MRSRDLDNRVCMETKGDESTNDCECKFYPPPSHLAPCCISRELLKFLKLFLMMLMKEEAYYEMKAVRIISSNKVPINSKSFRAVIKEMAAAFEPPCLAK